MNFSTPDLASNIKNTITDMVVKYDIKVPTTNERVLSSWILVVEKSALQIVSNDEIKVILSDKEVDLNNLPTVKDIFYIFEKESFMCDGKYVLEEINNNGTQVILNLIKEYSFEKKVNIKMLIENGKISKELRESLLSYINE